MNRMEQVAKMFDVELGQEFKIVIPDDAVNHERIVFAETWCFDEDGVRCLSSAPNTDICQHDASILANLLSGYYTLEKLLWKPKASEKYYVITFGWGMYSTDCTWWGNTGLDFMYYGSGNCFKTEEDAKAAIPWYKANVEHIKHGEKWQAEHE